MAGIQGTCIDGLCISSGRGNGPVGAFPASVTRCLTGLAVASDTTVQVTDSCTGMLIALTREAVP
jgi:hypothetical protein